LKFNQGGWYVGARVVRCREQFEKILEHKDLERAKELVKAGIKEDRMDKYFPRELIKNKCLRNKFVEEIKKIDPQLVES
jgi:DNA polymerase elongation subunit (family B)